MTQIKRIFGNFQLVSDLHLNANKFVYIKPMRKNLLICGDLSDGWPDTSHCYIKDLSPHFEKIFMVAGNHELMNPTGYFDSIKRMKESQSIIPNFYFLNNEKFIMTDGYEEKEDIRNESKGIREQTIILGTSLWSHIPECYHDLYNSEFNDYKRIKINSKNTICAELTNFWHEESLNFLKTELSNLNNHNSEKIDDGKSIKQDIRTNVIIMTHHSPLIEGTCLTRYYINGRTKFFNHAYCTDLSLLLRDLSNSDNISNITWVFGHTHYGCRFWRNNIGFMSNPLGFPNKFKKNKGMITVPTRTLDQLFP